TAILAPHRRSTRRAAKDLVRSAAVGRHRNRPRFAGNELDPVGLDQRIDDEGAAGLALAIAAVTAMHEHRHRTEVVSDRAAGATARQIVLAAAHDFGLLGHQRRTQSRSSGTIQNGFWPRATRSKLSKALRQRFQWLSQVGPAACGLKTMFFKPNR